MYYTGNVHRAMIVLIAEALNGARRAGFPRLLAAPPIVVHKLI